jgi:formylglycine-generating enzyme required for sulfatase activity
MKLAMKFATLAMVLTLNACSQRSVIVRIDTDLPSPEIASKMRIEIQSESGTPIAVREVDLLGPQSLPVSFAIEREEKTRLRVRVYPQSRTNGAGDPDPAVTVDRIALIPSKEDDRETFGLLLRGECAGTPANPSDGTSCADETRRAIPLAIPVDDVGATRSNTLREPCTDSESTTEHACIPGGVFILGDRNARFEVDPEFFLEPTRERLVHIKKFYADRNEITVARYRAATAAGFKAGAYLPRDNNAPLIPEPTKPTACTYSKSPIGREEYALNCLPYTGFQELCEYLGGSLPTEAQWEYLATAAGSGAKRIFPYGDDPPTCEQIVHARAVITPGCNNKPAFPPTLLPDGSAYSSQDVTPLGVFTLGGGLSEFVRDPPRRYDDPCWTQASFHNSYCDLPQPNPKDDTAQVGTRGSNWAGPAYLIQGVARLKGPVSSPFYGARCVYTTR